MRQVRELILKEQADIVGLQETIKQEFTNSELESLAPGGCLVGNGYRRVATRGEFF